MYERCMQQKINEYFQSILSKIQCDFRQGYRMFFKVYLLQFSQIIRKHLTVYVIHY